MGAIHSEGRNNHDIMQFCVAIKGLHNRKYFGAICSAVTLEEINNKLSTIFSAATHGNFKLRNSDYKSNKKIYTIDEAFSFSELFKACFSNEKIIIHFPIQNHPFLVEVELKPYKLGVEVMLILLLCVGCIQVMAIFIYLLFLIYKKYYQKPLFSIQSKLNEFPEDMINQQARLKLVNANVNNNIDVFVSVVNELLEDYRSLYINSRKDNTELEEIELYNNILYLILSERYKNSSKLINNTNLSILYFNQLKKLINEEQRECNLSEFLKDLVKGYSKYYKFPTIDILISEEDCKKFTCKQSSLSEAIGQMIALVLRIEKEGLIEESPITLKGHFEKEGVFPTISLEIQKFKKDIKWVSTPDYINNGFLSVYSLARYNNILFSIKCLEGKIIFILEPIESNVLDKLNDHFN